MPQNTQPLNGGTDVELTGLHKPTETMDDQTAETPAVPSDAAASSTVPVLYNIGPYENGVLNIQVTCSPEQMRDITGMMTNGATFMLKGR